LQTIYPFVLLKEIPIKDRTESGLIICQHQQQSKLIRNKISSDSVFPWKATVEYVPDKISLPMGSEVVFLRFNAVKVVDDLVRVPFSDILAVLE